jgi:hypothetical protein
MKIVDRIASLVDLLRRRKKTSTQRVAIERLRLSDAVARYLVDARALEAQPSFDLRWTRERRDRAIETIRAQLRAAPSQPVRSDPPSPHRRGAATTDE